MADPITSEIVRNYLETTCEEIMQTMVRTSISPIFNEAHDCSAGIFYYDGNEVSLVARADSVPVHIYACLTSVKACLDFFHGDLNDGDVLIVSDPYFGGSHIADYTVVKPIFFDGRPLFFPAVRGHVLDVGGPMPGGSNINASEIWQDGFRFSPLRLVEAGKPRREVWDLLRSNNRLPDMVIADINSMIGACVVGEQRIRALSERYGVDEVVASVGWIFDYSERQFRERIRQWPDGTYVGESILDTDYSRRDLAVRVAVQISGDSIIADFTGTDEQSNGCVNSVAPNSLSYVYSVFSALCPDIPLNSGFFRPLTAILPEGSVVNPRAPASTVTGTVLIGADIGEAVMKACEGFAPERVSNGVFDAGSAFAWGVDARTNQFFVLYDFYNCCVGSGATSGTDGWGGWSALYAAITLPSIEMTEVQYPVIYNRVEFVPDSAAPGTWRGSPGCGVERDAYKSAGPLTLNLAIQGLRYPLHGWVGGHAGSGTYGILAHGTQREEVVTEVAYPVTQQPGEPLYWEKGGGGGWGEALARDPEAVLADVMDGIVSIEGARRDYGVHIDPVRQTVLGAETRAERTALLAARQRDVTRALPLGRESTLRRTGLLTTGAPEQR